MCSDQSIKLLLIIPKCVEQSNQNKVVNNFLLNTEVKRMIAASTAFNLKGKIVLNIPCWFVFLKVILK